MQYLIKLITSFFVLFCAGSLAANGKGTITEQQFAKLPLPQQLWFKLEAKRESTNNSVSKESAIKAIHSADNVLDLADVPIESAICFVMMNIARDAENEMREVLDDIDKLNKNKSDQRGQLAKQRAETASSGAIKSGVTQHPVHSKIVRSAVLDEALSSKKMNFDSLSALSEDQYLKLQAALDRYAKAEDTLSNTLKKISNTQSSITGNIK